MGNLFENCSTSKKQGSLGEARAIYEYTKLGFIVSKPLQDCDYDLIIEKDGVLKRIQVKTTTQVPKGKYFVCNLRVLGGNQSFNTAKNRNPESYDELFAELIQKESANILNIFFSLLREMIACLSSILFFRTTVKITT